MKARIGLAILVVLTADLCACGSAALPLPTSPPSPTMAIGVDQMPGFHESGSHESESDTPGPQTPEPTTTTPRPTATSTPPPTATSTSTPSPTPTPSPSLTPSPTPTPQPEQLIAAPGTAWNFKRLGHNAIGAIGWHAALALKDRCAYVGNYRRSAVTIVDVSDPANPTTLEPLSLPAGTQPVELRTIPELDLLVVTDLSPAARLFTYDVSDCATPQPLGSMTLVHPAHEFYLWHDGSRVLAYVATFDHYPPNLVVTDLTDPTQPHEVARWSATDDGVPGILHSLSVSRDGTRAYTAMWSGGTVVLDVDLPQIQVARGPEGGFRPAGFPNTHSAVPLEDARFVLLASEVFYCPFEGLAVVDISDSAYLGIISHFRLPENRCDNLPGPPGGTFTPHNPLIVGNMALVSWYAAGVQAVDLSDPAAPARLGQFVPQGLENTPPTLLGSYPAQMFSYPIVRDGLIYVADTASGLYVLRYAGPRADWLAGVAHAEGNVTVLP
jgi:hypothetical protein